jgi:hypothetical protein
MTKTYPTQKIVANANSWPMEDIHLDKNLPFCQIGIWLWHLFGQAPV